MILEVAQTCLQILQAIKKCRDEMKTNWADCKRLADRCLAYEPILGNLREDQATAGLDALNNLYIALQSAYDLIQKFSERTYFRGMTRMVCRKKYAGEFAAVNINLDRCAIDFQLVYDVMKRREEDIEVCFRSFFSFLCQQFVIRNHIRRMQK